jgi:sulfate permease, SulP family
VVGMGIVAGVVLGIFIACVSFVVTLSRSPNIRHTFTAQTRRANVERSIAEQAYLRAHGENVRGFTLQGVLFFGTASRLLDEIRGTLANTRVVLLDFRLVHGIDGSSIVAMKRVHAICREAGVQLVLTALTPRMATLLSRGGFDLAAAHVRRFAELDRGLEWCEDFLLSEANAGGTLADVLRKTLSDDGVRRLFEACEHRQIAKGAVLVRQGEPSNEMFFVQRGRVHVLLQVGQVEESKRLRTYGAGTIVGEMGFYSGEPRSADIFAEQDTEVVCISRERLEAIERSDPELARALHRHVILTLAQRLRAANDEIRVLFS